ncbi:MAG: diphthine--ammonia ligase [Nitrosopumilus sp.]|jgi:diphthine-ammonia ligase
MKLASFFSGGKDSVYSINVAKENGHEINCLLTVLSNSEESHLLHHPNLNWTNLQSQSMNIEQLTISSFSDNTDDELDLFEKLIYNAKKKFEIDGIVHGGIKSKFQKNNFEKICQKLDLKLFSPLWEKDPYLYMEELIQKKFEFIISSVSSDGLDEKWLGKNISSNDVHTLKSLSEKFGFNLNFEGGEAETFVVNCPLFTKMIKINQYEKIWDGYRGRFEIVDAELVNHA